MCVRRSGGATLHGLPARQLLIWSRRNVKQPGRECSVATFATFVALQDISGRLHAPAA